MSESNSPDAAHCALANPELLEAILLNLPLSDLLVRAPRVCRLFRDTIKQSVLLQQALYFTPKHDILRPVPNPLIRHIPSAILMFLDKRFPKPGSVPGNPYARYAWPEDPMSDLKPFPGWQQEVHKSFDREEASWKRMLVIQPPVKELSLFRTYQDKFLSEQYITLGMLRKSLWTRCAWFFIKEDGRARMDVII